MFQNDSNWAESVHGKQRTIIVTWCKNTSASVSPLWLWASVLNTSLSLWGTWLYWGSCRKTISLLSAADRRWPFPYICEMWADMHKKTQTHRRRLKKRTLTHSLDFILNKDSNRGCSLICFIISVSMGIKTALAKKKGNTINYSNWVCTTGASLTTFFVQNLCLYLAHLHI